LSGEVTSVNEELHKVQETSKTTQGAIREVLATPGNDYNTVKDTIDDTRVSIEDLQRVGSTNTPINFLNPIMTNGPYAQGVIFDLNEELNSFKQNTAT